MLILSRAGSETVSSYWKTILSAAVPDETGLIVLTGLKNLPGRRTLNYISIMLTRKIDQPFFPALPCILPLLDELPKGLVRYFATQFFSYRVWWVDHNQICSLRPDGSTEIESCSSTLKDPVGKSFEGNKSDSFSLVFIPPVTKEDFDLITTDVLSRLNHSKFDRSKFDRSKFDRSKFGAYHVLWKQSRVD